MKPRHVTQAHTHLFWTLKVTDERLWRLGCGSGLHWPSVLVLPWKLPYTKVLRAEVERCIFLNIRLEVFVPITMSGSEDVLVSNNQRIFVLKALLDGLRTDGRFFHDARKVRRLNERAWDYCMS